MSMSRQLRERVSTDKGGGGGGGRGKEGEGLVLKLLISTLREEHLRCVCV